MALACSFSIHVSMYLQCPLTPPKPLFCSRVPAVRAVASLEEAEGHQHLAGGHGGGCEQMSPLPLKGPGVATPGIFCTFLIHNPAFWWILWLRKWALPLFLSRPLCIGGNEDCWERAENRGQRQRVGSGSWVGAARGSVVAPVSSPAGFGEEP